MRLTYKTSKESVLVCRKCKYESKVSEIKKDSKIKRKSNVVVIDKKLKSLKTLPTVDAICPKCGGKKAETWTLPLGSQEKSDAIYYRCTSCGYTRRETD
jgi:DNA-directed RNA polymerase subunit M